MPQSNIVPLPGDPRNQPVWGVNSWSTGMKSGYRGRLNAFAEPTEAELRAAGYRQISGRQEYKRKSV